MKETIRELEVGDLTLPGRHAQARAAIDALGPGDALELVGAEAPRALLRELLEAVPSRYEWSFLEASPGRSRVALRRRSEEGPRSVTGYLQGDHERLDAIALEVDRLAAGESFVEARRRFGEFACGLGWHIDVEEQVLFPAFEEKTGMTRGPTTVMRAEHVDIRERMRHVTAALEASDAAATKAALGELTALLGAHNVKEERMLYPMTDRALGSADAQEALVRRIEGRIDADAPAS